MGENNLVTVLMLLWHYQIVQLKKVTQTNIFANKPLYKNGDISHLDTRPEKNLTSNSSL